MKVVWTNESLNHLIDIEEYISKDSPQRAINYINKLINRGASLTEHPYKRRIIPEFSLPEMREILERNYRSVYRVAKDRIEILTVFEGHRLIRPKEIFKTK